MNETNKENAYSFGLSHKVEDNAIYSDEVNESIKIDGKNMSSLSNKLSLKCILGWPDGSVG